MSVDPPAWRNTFRSRNWLPARPVAAVVIALICAFATAVVVEPAHAGDLNGKLDRARSTLDQTKHRAGVLTSTVERNKQRVTRLRGQVATLRSRAASVELELRRKETTLSNTREELVRLRERLSRARSQLEKRLVAIYESGEPDVLTVLLQADGYDDLITRSSYLERIQSGDAALASRVRGLRDRAEVAVRRARAARRFVAAKKQELDRTTSELAGRESRFESALGKQRRDLAATRTRKDKLSDHVANLQDRIAAQLRAAAAQSATPALRAGPVPDASAAGLIWPVEGVLTSPFGPRWGSVHPGIDIGAPMGTPIRAAADGTVVNAGPNGGYGNFTCIAHAGGLSTCYAHQAEIATSAGAAVKQGDVIGYVGSTGFSTGPHVHFEVRVDGNAVDPLGYL